MKTPPLDINIQNWLIRDIILTEPAKQLLFEYMADDTVHSVLLISFSELLHAVISRLESNPNKDVIKSILNTEILDSQDKCFTGRMSRLINCLTGFDDLIRIQISEKEQISNIIINIKDNLMKECSYTIAKHIELVKRELVERQYNSSVIDEYLSYIVEE
jgi:hypothetical protein